MKTAGTELKISMESKTQVGVLPGSLTLVTFARNNLNFLLVMGPAHQLSFILERIVMNTAEKDDVKMSPNALVSLYASAINELNSRAVLHQLLTIQITNVGYISVAIPILIVRLNIQSVTEDYAILLKMVLAKIVKE